MSSRRSLRGKAGFSAFASGKGALRMMVQSIAREYGPSGIHVAHVVIDGVIQGEKVKIGFPGYIESKGEDGALNISAIADAFFTLHDQHRSAWTQELDIRPFKEEFLPHNVSAKAALASCHTPSKIVGRLSHKGSRL